MQILARIVTLAIGYLCGSFLTAEIVARAFANTSAFDLGEGNPGMANIGKELGTRAALACLAGDILKTVLAVVASRLLFPDLGAAGIAWAGLGATLGHDFPFWHGFRGGKGVTTIASTAVLLAPLWALVAAVAGVAAIALTGYLSVAAMVAVCLYAAACWFVLPTECFVIALGFVALSLYGHWSKLAGIPSGRTKKSSLFKKGHSPKGQAKTSPHRRAGTRRDQEPARRGSDRRQEHRDA